VLKVALKTIKQTNKQTKNINTYHKSAVFREENK
jgi:hypothetical protein